MKSVILINRHAIWKLVLCLIAACHLTPEARACPMLADLPDFNCDGQLKIAATGDSIVRGIGDTVYFNETTGGYVALLEQMLPQATVANIGVPGASSLSLFRLFKRNAPRGGRTTELLQDVDYLVIQVGTNDFWSGRRAPSVIRNIRRLREFLTLYYEERGMVPPLLVTATLPPTKRSFQQPFIDEVNAALLLSRNVERLNVQLRFDTLKSQRVISIDDLHPSTKGYKIMAARAQATLFSEIRSMALLQREDTDKDGIYDYFEISLYGTDPTLADTDGDGYQDGVEIFLTGTDPLDPESYPGSPYIDDPSSESPDPDGIVPDQPQESDQLDPVDGLQ